MPLNVQDKQLVNYRKPGLNVDFPQTIQHIQHSTECLIWLVGTLFVIQQSH